MIPTSSLPFAREYVSALSQELRSEGKVGLSYIQERWLSFVLLGILLTGSLCWARLERGSGGAYQDSALSKMFYHGIRCWDWLLRASTKMVLSRYGITNGVLVIDDTDRGRSKRTTRIFGVHKTIDKGTNGFHFAQNIVLLLLVTPTVTIPVGVRFYRPDPALSEWKRQDATLREQGVSVHDRPREPERNPEYPTRESLAISLVEEFRRDIPSCAIIGIDADAAYFTKRFMAEMGRIYPKAQILSQMRSNQKIKYGRGREMSVEEFFKKRQWRTAQVKLRGHLEMTVSFSSAYVEILSHGVKYLVVALKYEGENEPRYIVASKQSWRPEDVIVYYSFRWLVEVFFEDWKQHEGWAQLAYQQAYEGSRRGLILSLLLDHCLLLHPEQSARLEHKLPAFTVGSLRSAVTNEALVASITEVIEAPDPLLALDALKIRLKNNQVKNESTKHIVGRDIPRFRQAKIPSIANPRNSTPAGEKMAA